MGTFFLHYYLIFINEEWVCDKLIILTAHSYEFAWHLLLISKLMLIVTLKSI